MTSPALSSPKPLLLVHEPSSPQSSTKGGIRVAEPAVTVCRPIVPLGDLARSAAIPTRDAGPTAPFQYVGHGDDVRWRLLAEGWELTSPPLPTEVGAPAASFEAVMDVYVGLLAAFAAAALPQDNTVRFSPAPFVRGLGWTSGSTRGTPSGGHYLQLELALDYLRLANIESDAVRARLEMVRGTRVLRANFSVLQSWSKTAVDSGIGGAVQIEARFSDWFADLLRHDGAVVHYCVTKYAALPRGVTRALFRYIEGVRASAAEPILRVPARTLLTHIGSRRRDLEPSRMKAILDEPHQLLFANGVIGDIPRWSKSTGGQTELIYTLERAPDLGSLLEETAIAFGVAVPLAQQWAAEQQSRLAEVLAATIQGMLTPTKSTGRMVHDYMLHERAIVPAALPHFEPGRGITVPKRRSPEFEFLKEQYVATRNWLNERTDVEKALSREHASEAREHWVTDGLVLLVARRMRQAENIRAWSSRVGRGSARSWRR